MYLKSKYPKNKQFHFRDKPARSKFYFVGFFDEQDVVQFFKDHPNTGNKSDQKDWFYLFNEGSLLVLKSALDREMITKFQYSNLCLKCSDAPPLSIVGWNVGRSGKFPFKEYRYGSTRWRTFEWIHDRCIRDGFFITSDYLEWYVETFAIKKQYRAHLIYLRKKKEANEICKLDEIIKYKDKDEPAKDPASNRMSTARARLGEHGGRIREDIPYRRLIKHCKTKDGKEIKSKFKLTLGGKLMYFHVMKKLNDKKGSVK